MHNNGSRMEGKKKLKKEMAERYWIKTITDG